MSFRSNIQKGQGLTEYAILLSLVAVASIAATAFFGGAIKGKIAALSGAIAGQNINKIEAAEQKAQLAAEKAQENASQISGNTTIKVNEDIFDIEKL